MCEITGGQGDGRGRGERRGRRGEKEFMGKAANAPKVVNRERDEGDALIIKSANVLGTVRCVGGAAVQF
jgi:hypothetical protein